MNKFIKYCKEKKIFIAFILMLLYVLPLVFFSVFYHDDLGRKFSGQAWNHNARFFATLVMKILGLNKDFLADFSPLPLFLALFSLLLSSYYLAYKYNFEKKQAFLLALSSLISPFFLENLSYKYDVFGMSLALALAIFASVFCTKNKMTFFSYLLLAWLFFLILGLYQVALNSFFILFFFFLYFKLEKENFKEVGIFAFKILALAALLLLFYKAISTFFVAGTWSLEHSQSLPLAFSSFLLLKNNFLAFLKYFFSIYKGFYAYLNLIFFLLAFGLCFYKSSKRQKIYLPFFFFLSLFFLAGVLLALKEIILMPRVFLGASALYLLLIFILLIKLPKNFIFLPLCFIFFHFVQAYSFYNALNDNEKATALLYSKMSDEVNNIDENFSNVVLFGLKKSNVQNDKTFAIIDKILLKIEQHWSSSLRFKENFINISSLNQALPKIFMNNCNNVFAYKRRYNIYLYGKNIIFDLEKLCSFRNVLEKSSLPYQKIPFFKALKDDLILENIYIYEDEKKHLLLEFNHNPLNYSSEKDKIFFLKLFEKDKNTFIKQEQELNDFFQLGDKFYYNFSFKKLNLEDFDKIEYGFLAL